MPRKYKRIAPQRQLCTQEQLDAAKAFVQEGFSRRTAAIKVGVKESTLRKRLLRGSAAESLGRYLTFNKEQETDLYNSLKKCNKLYHGLTIMNLRKLVYEYAESNKIVHRFSKSTKMAGRDWIAGFLKRHPGLKTQRQNKPEVTREMKLNRNQVYSFFDNLESLCKKFNFTPNRIYNVSEIGIDVIPDKIPKVIPLKGKKTGTAAVERGQTITLVCAMNPIGHFVPPAFIFPDELKNENQIEDGPTGSIAFASELGFINFELFSKYLEHFKHNIEVCKENRILLILDNHNSHISVGAVKYCRDNGIHMLILPPNSNHKMQPLDLGLFEAFERKFHNVCDKWLTQNPGSHIQAKAISTLVNKALNETATCDYASYSFKATGIWPIDRKIIPDEDFKLDLPVTSSPVRSVSSSEESFQEEEVCVEQGESFEIRHNECSKALGASTSKDPLADVDRRIPLSSIQVPQETTSTKLQRNGDEARLKWKYIRDQARKECRKQDSEWDLLPRLQFLINQFNDYEGAENDTFGQDSFTPDINDDHDADQEPFYMEATTVKDDEFDEFDTKPIITETDFYDDDEEPSKSTGNNEPIDEQKDEDVGFFNSLLPHIRKLGPAKKLMLRMKIQELVYNTVYNET